MNLESIGVTQHVFGTSYESKMSAIGIFHAFVKYNI